MIKDNTTWIDKLKKSPIFNMSLSNKELFHSNFWAWLLNSYHVEMGKFFIEKLDLQEDAIISDVQREKENIDISFKLNDTLILIENKVKSIPYIEQLRKYEEKFEKKTGNKKYILLTIKEPKIKADNWNYISYTELVEYLETFNIGDKYHHSLIVDYISFIQCLQNNIVNNINLSGFQISNIYDKQSDECKLINQLTDIKMHDFFLKGIFEELAYQTYSLLRKKIKSIQFIYGESPKEASCLITHGMTRAQGLLDIKYKFYDIIIGIQIQGNQYRQFIEGNKEKLATIAKQLNNEKLWFNFNNADPKDNLKIYPTQESKNFNVFNGKKNLFLYKSIKINNLSNEDLLNMIKGDVHYLVNDLDLSNIKGYLRKSTRGK